MDVSSAAPLVNRAAKGKSAYAREQKDSPVAWQLLDEEAISRAKADDKLIFLHIGYSACHYSRLMTTETFAYPAIAHALNRSFIPVIIDRDERPDLDSVYMNYLEAVHAVGGWPLNVFLTPELEPVFGGTYWAAPNNDRHASTDDDDDDDAAAADFHEILHMLQKLWTEQRSRLRQEAHDNVGQLLAYASEGTSSEPPVATVPEATATSVGLGLKGLSIKAKQSGPLAPPAKVCAPATEAPLAADDLDIDLFDTAFTHIASTFDPIDAGFTKAPKYVTAPKLSLLLRLPFFPSIVRDMVGYDETHSAQNMALATLRAIDRSALHDHLGRGFSRASLTTDWSLPFFERIMVENALLLGLFTDAWLATGAKKDSGEFFQTILETAEYLSSAPLLGASGLLASSEFADSRLSQHDEQTGPGAYFLWSRREFDSVLESGPHGKLAADVAAAHWNVRDHGNISADNDPNDDFVNRNVLRVVADVPTLAAQFNQPEAQIQTILIEARAKLAAFRDKERIAPQVSGNAVAGYNGVAIGALARTGAALLHVEKNLGERYISVAEKIAAAVKKELWDENEKVLYRLVCDGTRSCTRGFAEDYAYVIEGLLALHTATLKNDYISWASDLQDSQTAQFLDTEGSRGGFFTAAADAHADYLLLRLKAGMDSTLPAANGVAAGNLFALGALVDGEKGDAYKSLADKTVEAFEVELLHFPWLFLGLLGAVVTYRLGVESVGGGEEEVKKVRLAPRGAVVVVKKK